MTVDVGSSQGFEVARDPRCVADAPDRRRHQADREVLQGGAAYNKM
jgi:hypothetical protein